MANQNHSSSRSAHRSTRNIRIVIKPRKRLLCLRSCCPNILWNLKSFEILGEACREIGGGLVVSSFDFPGAAGVEECRWNPWARFRNRKPKGGLHGKLRVG